MPRDLQVLTNHIITVCHYCSECVYLIRMSHSNKILHVRVLAVNSRKAVQILESYDHVLHVPAHCYCIEERHMTQWICAYVMYSNTWHSCVVAIYIIDNDIIFAYCNVH